MGAQDYSSNTWGHYVMFRAGLMGIQPSFCVAILWPALSQRRSDSNQATCKTRDNPLCTHRGSPLCGTLLLMPWQLFLEVFVQLCFMDVLACTLAGVLGGQGHDLFLYNLCLLTSTPTPISQAWGWHRTASGAAFLGSTCAKNDGGIVN